jgi:hypothetical protein
VILFAGRVADPPAPCHERSGPALEAFFFRTHDGLEADLVIASGGSLEAIEIKLTSVPSEQDLARIGRVADLLGARRATLLTRASRPACSARRWSVNLDAHLERC